MEQGGIDLERDEPGQKEHVQTETFENKLLQENLEMTEEELNTELKQRQKRTQELENKTRIKSQIEVLKMKEADLEKETKKRPKKQDTLTANVFCEELQIYQINNVITEKQEQLCIFTKRCIIEENEKCPLRNVELLLEFSFEGTSNIRITKGTGDQKIHIFFDEKGEPTFQWENTCYTRRIWVFLRTFFKTENIKDMVKKVLSNPKSVFQNSMDALQSVMLVFAVNKLKSNESQSTDEAGNGVSNKKVSRKGSEQDESEKAEENLEDQSKQKTKDAMKAAEKQLSAKMKSKL